MHFLNKKNMNMFVGLLSLLILLWLVMYFIPSIFVNLFDTTLGNFLLLIVVVMAGMRDMTMGVGLAVVLLVLYRFSRMSTMYMFEGMTTAGKIKPLAPEAKKK
jgi:hypothetical protein